MKSFSRFDERCEHFERLALRRRFNLLDNLGEALFFHWQIAIRAELPSGFGEEQPQEMINFCHRRDCRFAAATRDPLLNRDTRRQAFNKIDIGFFKLLDELPRIGRHAVEESSLSFRKQNVERERRFA